MQQIRNNTIALLKQVKNAQNPQEVQNLTNAVLAQIMNLSMLQYEMLTTSNNVMIEFLDKQELNNNRTYTKESYNKSKEGEKSFLNLKCLGIIKMM